MNLNEAMNHIKAKNPSMSPEAQEILNKALRIIDEEIGFLDSFSVDDLQSLYRIEKLDMGYFPGLSKAAADTMIALHTANNKLPVSLLLSTTADLAGRGRPWESLAAFSRIAKSCPKQIDENMLTYLLNQNSDYLEICSHRIEEEASKAKSGCMRFFACIARTKPEPNIQDKFDMYSRRHLNNYY